MEEAAVARRLGREQAYLAGLAGQYRLEQYPDSYEAMCEWAGGSGQASPRQLSWGGQRAVFSLQQSLLSRASCTTGSPGLLFSPRTPEARRTWMTPWMRPPCS